MSEKDGGPVFPLRTGELPYRPAYDGISLRDWFAGQALAGLCAGFPDGYKDKLADGTYGGLVPATVAYALADAMLKARTQGES